MEHNYQEDHLMHQTKGDKRCGSSFLLELGAPHVTEVKENHREKMQKDELHLEYQFEINANPFKFCTIPFPVNLQQEKKLNSLVIYKEHNLTMAK